jgi:hypothetical protein
MLCADRWSPYEVALFESGICLFGKMFSQLHAVVRALPCRTVPCRPVLRLAVSYRTVVVSARDVCVTCG